jgi:hypothetical protein
VALPPLFFAFAHIDVTNDDWAGFSGFGKILYRVLRSVYDAVLNEWVALRLPFF